jgi:hypothetical protein
MKDPYLLAKALAYAIVAIEARPEAIRERADYNDMVFLFRKLPATEQKLFLEEAQRDLTGDHVNRSFGHLPRAPAREATGEAPCMAPLNFD